MRKKNGGHVTSISRDAPKSTDKFFYTLKLKQATDDKSSIQPRTERIKHDHES